jgi:hypothetical protein
MTRETKLFTVFGLIMFILLNVIMLGCVLLNLLAFEYFLYVDLSLLLAALVVFLALRFSHMYVNVLKLSLLGWLVISIILIASNLIIERKITWAYYPVVGALFWPISVYIFSYLDSKIK